MRKYQANSYYLIIRIIFLTIPILIIGYIIYVGNLPNEFIYGGILLSSVILLYIIKLLRNLVFVEFNESNLIITFMISKNEKIISYSDLIELTCIDGQRGYHFNVIKFKSSSFSNSKITVDRIVDSDKFISFLKWLKDKNERIELNIIPSDSKLIPEFHKEFVNK
jgi:voltage-gated potassium channel Kch